MKNHMSEGALLSVQPLHSCLLIPRTLTVPIKCFFLHACLLPVWCQTWMCVLTHTHYSSLDSLVNQCHCKSEAWCVRVGAITSSCAQWVVFLCCRVDSCLWWLNQQPQLCCPVAFEPGIVVPLIAVLEILQICWHAQKKVEMKPINCSGRSLQVAFCGMSKDANSVMVANKKSLMYDVYKSRLVAM